MFVVETLKYCADCGPRRESAALAPPTRIQCLTYARIYRFEIPPVSACHAFCLACAAYNGQGFVGIFDLSMQAVGKTSQLGAKKNQRLRNFFAAEESYFFGVDFFKFFGKK